MSDVTTIVIRTAKGFESHQPVLPARWRGQPECMVGPFSSHRVAENFARPAVEFGHYDVPVIRIFAKRDSWYVEMGTPSTAPIPGERERGA